MTIGYLQSHDNAVDRMYLLSDGSFATNMRGDEEELPLMGSYSVETGELVVFYRWKGQLQLQVKGEPPIPLEDTTNEWLTDGENVEFRLLRDGDLLLERRYPLNRWIKFLPHDYTPLVEAEHFDFFLFARNVCAGPNRATIFGPEHWKAMAESRRPVLEKIGYIQSHDYATEKQYVQADGSFTWAEPPNSSALPLLGVYSDKCGKLVVFWRRDGELQLLIGDRLAISLEGAECEWHAENEIVDFQVSKDGRLLYRHRYPMNHWMKTLAWDPAPPGEPEDFDLYLFVCNVCADPRRHVIFGGSG